VLCAEPVAAELKLREDDEIRPTGASLGHGVADAQGVRVEISVPRVDLC
jgi:hypothetical protein